MGVELWLAELNEGRSQSAWNLFLDRYRPLIVATITRLLDDDDDVMDVFSIACEALSENDCARLKRYSTARAREARVSTWLVAVVRNLTIDWIRTRDGRHRLTVPSTLTPLRQAIYAATCIEGLSHVEAYESIVARGEVTMPFHEFLREVRATQREAPCPNVTWSRRPIRDPALDNLESSSPSPADIVESAESARRIAAALTRQPPDVRLAVELFVVDRVAAAEVARVVGWDSAKSVYNRVYRALAAIRAELEKEGIGREDF